MWKKECSGRCNKESCNSYQNLNKPKSGFSSHNDLSKIDNSIEKNSTELKDNKPLKLGLAVSRDVYPKIKINSFDSNIRDNTDRGSFLEDSLKNPNFAPKGDSSSQENLSNPSSSITKFEKKHLPLEFSDNEDHIKLTVEMDEDQRRRAEFKKILMDSRPSAPKEDQLMKENKDDQNENNIEEVCQYEDLPDKNSEESKINTSGNFLNLFASKFLQKRSHVYLLAENLMKSSPKPGNELVQTNSKRMEKMKQENQKKEIFVASSKKIKHILKIVRKPKEREEQAVTEGSCSSTMSTVMSMDSFNLLSKLIHTKCVKQVDNQRF